MKKIFSILALVLLLAACAGNYGEKIQLGKGELYYTEKVSKDEAERVGKFLQESGFINENKVSYQIDKEAQHFIFKLILADEKYAKDQRYIGDIQMLGGFMSHDALNNQPVEMWLCNNTFEPLHKIPFKQLSDSILQKAREEDLQNPNQQMVPDNDPLPKDNVSPVDTAEQGTPA